MFGTTQVNGSSFSDHLGPDRFLVDWTPGLSGDTAPTVTLPPKRWLESDPTVGHHLIPTRRTPRTPRRGLSNGVEESRSVRFVSNRTEEPVRKGGEQGPGSVAFLGGWMSSCSSFNASIQASYGRKLNC